MFPSSRRSFLQSGLGAAALGALGVNPLYSADGERRNVLFIAVDDLNDWIGCLGGHPQSQTPNIDRFAESGVLFTRAYCAAPACNPSRASLLTGVRPSTSGVYVNAQPWQDHFTDVTTLPMHFKNNGYATHGRGKLFHGRYSYDPPAWDEYVESGNNPSPENLPVNGIPRTAHFDWGPVDVDDEEMDDTKIAHWAERFLAGRHDDPFFLACGLYRPHLPWYVPRKYFDRFPAESVTLPVINENDLDDVPPAGRAMAKPDGDHKKVTETENWRKAVSGYLASIAYTDATLGILFNALETSAYADNTVVVLWGDHGWHLGEKLHWRKFALWEEATRCPLIVSTPESRKSGKKKTESGRTVSLLDIYPTLCDLCGFGKPDALEGDSLVPLLDDPDAKWDRPALTTHGYRNHSLRSERYRYIQYEDGSEELYDHAADPLEWKNLASDPMQKAVINELKRFLPEVNAPFVP